MPDVSLIYLLNSSTVPLDPRVWERMRPLFSEDPSAEGSPLTDPSGTVRILETARAEVAGLVGARAEEILFTSSGTEACNLALKGVGLASLASGRAGPSLLAASTEHAAILNPARTLAKLGIPFREIPVDRSVVVDLDALADMARERPLLISVALATTETGTLQPIREIARIAREAGALLHTDACLASAWLPMDVKSLGVDLASFSAHKMAGPRGAGALYAREGVRLLPQIEGGTEEGGRRAGAHYLAGIAGFGAAAALRRRELADLTSRIEGLAATLLEGLMTVDGVELNGHPSDRLAEMVNVSVRGVDGEAVLVKLARRGIAASSGSSCVEEAGLPSRVLTAMGMPRERAQGSVLFAVGAHNTHEEIATVIGAFSEAVASLRAISGSGRPRSRPARG